MLSVVDWQDNPVGVISTGDWDLVDKDVVSVQDQVEALARLVDAVETVLVHINGDHLRSSRNKAACTVGQVAGTLVMLTLECMYF